MVDRGLANSASVYNTAKPTEVPCLILTLATWPYWCRFQSLGGDRSGHLRRLLPARFSRRVREVRVGWRDGGKGGLDHGRWSRDPAVGPPNWTNGVEPLPEGRDEVSEPQGPSPSPVYNTPGRQACLLCPRACCGGLRDRVRLHPCSRTLGIWFLTLPGAFPGASAALGGSSVMIQERTACKALGGTHRLP